MKAIVVLLLLSRTAHASWRTDPPYHGQKYADVPGVRGLLIDPAGDILAVSKTDGTISAIYQTNEVGVNVCQTVIVSEAPTALNHGIGFHEGYLYASSRTAVYRWPYKSGQRQQVEQAAQTVVNNIPSPGHQTR